MEHVTKGRLAFALVCRAITLVVLALGLAFGTVYGSRVRWVDPEHGEVPPTTTTRTTTHEVDR